MKNGRNNDVGISELEMHGFDKVDNMMGSGINVMPVRNQTTSVALHESGKYVEPGMGHFDDQGSAEIPKELAVSRRDPSKVAVIKHPMRKLVIE